jgi:AraC family transcriptional activator of pobA
MTTKQGQKPLFEIQTLESIAGNRPDQWDAPKRSELFEIMWIRKGAGTYLIDLEKHEISGDIVYCIDVGQLHYLQASTDIEGYQLSFSPQFLYLSEDNTWPLFEMKGYSQSGMARIIQADEDLKREMEVIMGKMVKEFLSFALLRSEILKGWLKILMIYLTRTLEIKKPEKSVGRNSDLVRRFMVSLESNLTKRKSVSDYARELGVSANYLNEIIKKVTGSQAYYHIQQRKVLEAKRQAICNGKSMKEVAYYLGFDDLSHFSRFFKMKTGSNFTEFKKEMEGCHYL